MENKQIEFTPPKELPLGDYMAWQPITGELVRRYNVHGEPLDFVAQISRLEMRGDVSGYDMMIAAARRINKKAKA